MFIYSDFFVNLYVCVAISKKKATFYGEKGMKNQFEIYLKDFKHLKKTVKTQSFLMHIKIYIHYSTHQLLFRYIGLIRSAGCSQNWDLEI